MPPLKTILRHKAPKLVLAILATVTLYYGYTYRYNLWQFSGLNRVPKIFHTHPEKYCIGCHNLFPDKVATQATAYASPGEGIAPQETYTGLKKLQKQGKLKQVSTTRNYYIAPLSHSFALLRPKAILFLNHLGNEYQNDCKKAGIGFMPFRISSLTRTKESIQHLKGQEGNAIENSGHLRGKTFDVSYTAFGQNEKALAVFVKTLSRMRQQNRCYVKYEKNGCLHITVR
jgi:hypothetical protein